MFKWCALFAILAVAVGYYWMVMSGTWADRQVDVLLQAALKEATVGDLITRLEAMRERVDGQEALVKKLAFMARNPDWSRLKKTRQEVDGLLAAAKAVSGQTGDDIQSDGAQALHARMLKDVKALTVQTFLPQQRMFWSVIFWVFAVPTLLFALLSFVRA